MFAGQLEIYRGHDFGDPNKAFILFLAGLIVFAYTINGIWLHDGGTLSLEEPRKRLKIRWGWLAFSVGLAGWIADLTARAGDVYLWQYILLWLLSMIALVVALSPLKGDIVALKPLRKWEYGLILLLFLGAFAIRIININHEPYMLDGDEGLFTVEATDYIPLHFDFSPFQPGVDSHPRVYTAMIGVTTDLFGINLLGARLPSVLMGALTIPALFLLGRELRDWQAGLIAALFLMGWSFHIQFSRLAMNQPGDPLFSTLAFYFLLRGLRRGSGADYALCGIMTGLAQYFYMGGRLLPAIMIAYLLFMWLRDRQVIRRQWRLLLIVPVAALIVTLPQNFYLFYNKMPISSRLDHSDLFDGVLQDVISKGQLGEYLNSQVPPAFLALFSVVDRSAWYGTSTALMGIVGGPLLVIGLYASLLALWKRPKWCLAVGWAFTVILAGSALAPSPPEYERYVSAAPPLALLVEVGITLVALALATLLKRPNASRSIALGIGILAFVGNLAFYVDVYVPEGKYLAFRTNWLSNREAHQMVEEYDAGRQVVMLAQWGTTVADSLPVKYFMAGKPYVNGENSLAEALSHIDMYKPAAFLIPMERKADMDVLFTFFPWGKAYQVNLDENGEFAYYLFRTDHPANSAQTGTLPQALPTNG